MNKIKEPTIGVLLMSYGTPQIPDDLRDYMTSIRRGHDPSKQDIANLEDRYTTIGQWDNENLRTMTEQQGRALVKVLQRMVKCRDEQPSIIQNVYIGYQHMPPSIEDAVSQMKSDGIDIAIAIVTAPFYSKIGTSVYEERAQRAADQVGIELRMVREWWKEVGFADYWRIAIEKTLIEQVGPNLPYGSKSIVLGHDENDVTFLSVEDLLDDYERIIDELISREYYEDLQKYKDRVDDVALVLSAHSLPIAPMQNQLDPYVTSIQRFSCELSGSLILRSWSGHIITVEMDGQIHQGYASGLEYEAYHNPTVWTQAWQSAGPHGEWLGPSIETVIDRLIEDGYKHIVFAPIGFVSDHVEVLYDNDTVCRAQVESQGAKYYRASMPNNNEMYIFAMASAVEKRIVQ